jgi:hypothetical protein
MSEALTQAQVSAILCITKRRVQQMDVDGDGPPRTGSGEYPAAGFGEWLKKRSDKGHKDRLTKAQADVAELEAGEMAGELVRVAPTTERWGKMCAAFKARLLTIPPTLAPRIAAPGRAAEAQAELQRAIHEALTELADV